MKNKDWTPDPRHYKFDQPEERLLTLPLIVFLILAFVVGSWLWVEVIIKVIL